MSTDVFLSVGRTYLPEQEAFVADLEATLRGVGVNPRTVGRSRLFLMLSFHGLRHCAASLMLASGADIAVVSKLLGHTSIAITADVYGHLIGTIAQEAVDGAAT